MSCGKALIRAHRKKDPKRLRCLPPVLCDSDLDISIQLPDQAALEEAKSDEGDQHTRLGSLEDEIYSSGK
jgi:hypothetical protein